jgi:hypothetical protein
MQGLRAVVADGSVWQRVMARDFPRHELAPSCLADWRHAFLLHASCALQELRCFFTRQPFTEAALGLPFRFTVNPRTGARCHQAPQRPHAMYCTSGLLRCLCVLCTHLAHTTCIDAQFHACLPPRH